jgi:hypothetical protein
MVEAGAVASCGRGVAMRREAVVLRGKAAFFGFG